MIFYKVCYIVCFVTWLTFWLVLVSFVYKLIKDSIEKYMNYMYNLHSDILRCEMVQCWSYLLYDILPYPNLSIYYFLTLILLRYFCNKSSEGGCCNPLNFLYRTPDTLIFATIDTKMSTIELHMMSLWRHKVSAPSEIWMYRNIHEN